MKTSHREQERYARHASFIRRNKRRELRVRHFRQAREARNLAGEAAGLPPLGFGPIQRFELAPQIRIEELQPQVKFLLKALGHPEALVTDESLVWDMVRDGKKLVRLRRKLKIRISIDDYIFAVAEKLLARGK